MRKKKIPDEVVKLAEEVEAWRSTRPYVRSRVPGPLKERLRCAARKYSVATVQAVIKIDRSTLEGTAQRIKGKRAAVKVPSAMQFAPVKLEAPRLHQHAEIVNPNGWRLQVPGEKLEMAIRIFMEVQR